MDTPKAQPIVGILMTGLATCLIMGVFSFAAPCDVHGQGDTATCLWAGRVLAGIGVVILVLALVRIFETDEGERRGLSLSCSLLGFFVALIPGPLISVCSDPTMRCNAVMRPFAIYIGVAIGLVGATDLLWRLLALRTH